ncbi:hypothetical protein [Dyella choica]|uniref:Uncharacterized protein n=1 Tax=Dyella choica TaxID=1927959 RepID=A0A432LZE1_9GAMM|nr:hypothetical protein [Dyella choica]RUL69002.1 hypothetical protein EKH80_23020 [Dyella choica]
MSDHLLARKLTPGQRKLVAAVADDMVVAALNSAPMDRAACQEAIQRAYTHLGLALPKVMFFDSPIAAMREMLRRTPGTEPPPQRSMQEDMADPAASVLDQAGAALPRWLPDWGAEVDLSFNTELNRATDSAPYQPGWPSFSNLIDKRLGHLIHHKHAVDTALEAMVDRHVHFRLLYYSGPASLWGAAEDFARAQALAALDALDTPAPELALGQAVLAGCGWVNAFEKVCLVSDRPQTLNQEGRPQDADGIRTRVTWRDGQVCESVYQS